MTISDEQIQAIVSLTARGVPIESVAAAVRLSIPQVDKILLESSVASQVSEQTAGYVVTGLSADNRWDAIETAALDAIVTDMQRNSHVYEPGTLLAIAAQANKAKRRHGNDSLRDGVLGRNTDGAISVVVNMPTLVLDRMQKQIEARHADQLQIDAIGEKAYVQREVERDRARAANLHAKFATGGVSVKDVEAVMDLDLRTLAAQSQVELSDDFVAAMSGAGVIADDEDEMDDPLSFIDET